MRDACIGVSSQLAGSNRQLKHGAFGYETEHAAVSLRMAEHGLAPAVRAASVETVIVAAGTSCRQQILSATGRRALHPAEALAQRLTAQ